MHATNPTALVAQLQGELGAERAQVGRLKLELRERDEPKRVPA